LIDKDPRPLWPPDGSERRPPGDPSRLPPPDDEDRLVAGELRSQFAQARRSAGRAPRWLADLVGPPAVPQQQPDHAAQGPTAPDLERQHRQLEQRAAELEERLRRLDRREAEVLRREEAAARWFTDLNRAQRQLDDERRRQGGGYTNVSPLPVRVPPPPPETPWRGDAWSSPGEPRYLRAEPYRQGDDEHRRPDDRAADADRWR